MTVGDYADASDLDAKQLLRHSASRRKKEFVVLTVTQGAMPITSRIARNVGGIQTNLHLGHFGDVRGVATQAIADVNHRMQAVAQQLCKSQSHGDARLERQMAAKA